ncbi:MAG: hypothetical protein V1493_02835 [Candidatus Diapherotrites archaeon]
MPVTYGGRPKPTQKQIAERRRLVLFLKTKRGFNNRTVARAIEGSPKTVQKIINSLIASGRYKPSTVAKLNAKGTSPVFISPRNRNPNLRSLPFELSAASKPSVRRAIARNEPQPITLPEHRGEKQPWAPPQIKAEDIVSHGRGGVTVRGLTDRESRLAHDPRSRRNEILKLSGYESFKEAGPQAFADAIGVDRGVIERDIDALLESGHVHPEDKAKLRKIIRE